jgi:hypothetical protein
LHSYFAENKKKSFSNNQRRNFQRTDFPNVTRGFEKDYFLKMYMTGIALNVIIWTA